MASTFVPGFIVDEAIWQLRPDSGDSNVVLMRVIKAISVQLPSRDQALLMREKSHHQSDPPEEGRNRRDT